ncbi:RhuM family protein [Streptomyces sp. NPDC020792]|uniref:RhuM family protein n=1 Tax=Streptomyces sp. NPDC020792 TaxID=3365089 RepID=UPI00378FB1FE
MTTARTGRDGRPLVTTAMAAYSLGMEPASFRSWARRHGVTAASKQEEVRQTALARAREMVDYRIFRDMMADNAPDYEPSGKTTRMFFAAMQNKLYLHLVGLTAEEIKRARTLATWPGIDDGKPEPSAKSAARKVAKNYLTARELQKLNRLVGRLCLRAEDIADDGLHLSLTQWQDLVEVEVVMATRQIAA